MSDERPEDPDQDEQRKRGEREHHARMEQLQMGDENAETSLARSKAELPPLPEPPPTEPPPTEETDTRGSSEPVRDQEHPEPTILKAPYTQFRKL